MAKRKSLSVVTRFEIFKRDNFTCCYCGNHPPAIILEVDHIIPVSKGGVDTEGNLVTACFQCNRGKTDRPLDKLLPSINYEERIYLIQERAEQVRRYTEVLAAEKTRIEKQINEINNYWFDKFPGYWSDQALPSKSRVRQYLQLLTVEDIKDAIDIVADNRDNLGREKWRYTPYFIGVLKKKAGIVANA